MRNSNRELYKTDEAKILEAVNETLRGNKESFRIIIKAYEKPLYKMAFSFLKKSEEAEDALQEIFIKVYQSLDSFKLGYKFTPWIYAVAMNELRQIYRKKKKSFSNENSNFSQESISTNSHSEYTDPVESLEREEKREKVLKAIDSLKENLREVIVLYYLNDMSVEDISEILNIGRENVKSRLHRARKKLKKMLNEVQLE